MRKPLLTLSSKEWFTGISGSDYSGYGGIFKNAVGVSPIRSIGTFNGVANIGLLQGGPAGALGGTSVVVDNPIAGARNNDTTTASYLYVIGDGGHLYKKDNGAINAPTDLASGTQITSPSNGIGIFQPAGGSKYLYIFREAAIDRALFTAGTSFTGAYSTADANGWDYNWKTGLQTTKMHPCHNFLDSLFFGNDYYIGQIKDDGAADVTYSATALDFPQDYRVMALEDDGFYLIASLSGDKSSTGGVPGKIIFWDTTSTSWQREYLINDTVVALKRIGGVTYALGRRGIYEVSFGGGVNKIWQKGTIVGNEGVNRHTGPGMLSSYNDALIIAGDDGEVHFLGKPDPLLPYAYHTPILVDAGTGYQVGFVDGEFINGYIIAGDRKPALKSYQLSSTPNATGVSAETVYIPLAQRTKIDRIDLVFGRVLASGDTLTVKIRQDNMSTDTTVGTVSYATYGAQRRVSLTEQAGTFYGVECEDLKITFTFTAGTVALRKIDVYGEEILT